MANSDSTRQTLADFRRRWPPVSRTVNNNYVVALPVMSLLGNDPAYWRCFVNGYELKAQFRSADDLWENAEYIEADYRRSQHVNPRFFMIPVVPDQSAIQGGAR